jgi:prolyl-tRNA synthetase
VYDDRDMRPGEKFVEAELLGCPLRVVAGKRSLESGELEVQVRRGLEVRSVPLEGAARALVALHAELP